MADRNEKYRQRWREDMAAKVGEPVEAVGVFSRPGSMSSMFTMKVSPLAGVLKDQVGKSKAAGLPPNVAVGVTADKVFLFAYKPRGNSLKLKDPIGVFHRQAVRVEVIGQTSLATQLRFTLPTGDVFELDSNRVPGMKSDFNNPLLAALGAIAPG